MQLIFQLKTIKQSHYLWNINLKYQKHETAIVDKGAKIGSGSKIWHWTHVCGGAKIGSNVSLGQNVYVANKVIIGDQCKIQNNVSIYDNVYLEEGVFCGPSMVFTNVYNPRSLIERKSEFKDTFKDSSSTFTSNYGPVTRAPDESLKHCNTKACFDGLGKAFTA